MGLEILEPGCRKVRLAPQDVPFDYTATFATPRGPVTVARKAGKARIQAPDGIETEAFS